MGEGLVSSFVEAPLEVIDLTSRLVAVQAFVYKKMLDEIGVLDDIENLTGTDISVTLPDLEVVSRLGNAAIKGDYYEVVKTILGNVSILSPYKVGIPLAFEDIGQAVTSGDSRALFDSSLNMLLLARDYKKSNGQVVKGLTTLKNEYDYVLKKQIEFKQLNVTNVPEIIAWNNKAIEIQTALIQKMQEANALAKKQFLEIDRNKGNTTLHSPLKQAIDETPTKIKPVSTNASFLTTKDHLVDKDSWTYTQKAMELEHLVIDVVDTDVFQSWQNVELLPLKEAEVKNLPLSINAEDIVRFKVTDFTGLADNVEVGIDKTIQIIMVDEGFLVKEFGQNVDASFQLAKIPNSKDAVSSYTDMWVNDKSPLTIYMNKELLKTTEGFNTTLARMEDSITAMVTVLKKAEDDGKQVTYTNLQKQVIAEMDDYVYTNTLTERPSFCFAGNTLIHTERGLVPIQQIKTGDRVLSKDENNLGELEYQSVIRTIQTESVPIYYLSFEMDAIDESGSKLIEILVTDNHPFWVEGFGWMAAQLLQGDNYITLKDGLTARCVGVGEKDQALQVIYKTNQTHVGFIPDPLGVNYHGRFIDLNTAETISYGIYEPVTNRLEGLADLIQSPLDISLNGQDGVATTTVYNFEVEQTHTYFISEYGIWVHNVNCRGKPKKTLYEKVPTLPQDKANQGLWYYMKNLQDAVRRSDWKNAEQNIQGMVAFLEKTNPNKQHEHNVIYEQQGEGTFSIIYEYKDKNGNVTGTARSTISSTLVYINPVDGGMYYIKLGDGRIMLTVLDEHGNPVLDPITGKPLKEYSTVTIDAKSKTKWVRIDRDGSAESQVELLESLYRTSKALDQNLEYSHVIEFERAETVAEVITFLENYNNNPTQYQKTLEAFKKKFPKTYDAISKEPGMSEKSIGLSWLNERIYFAKANLYDEGLGYRPNPEEWSSLTRTADGMLEVNDVTRTQLYQEGKIKMAKNIADPSRDFVNSDLFKQNIKEKNSKQMWTNFQKIQTSETLEHTCFVGGTLVHTESGLVKIQDIQIGDRVLSADPVTGQQSYQAVSRVITTENQPVIYIDLQYSFDPKLRLSERLKLGKEVSKQFGMIGNVLPYMQFIVTPEHPFWVEGKGWVKVQDLTTEDVVIDKQGNKYTLNPIGYDGKPQVQLYKTAQDHIGLMPNYGLESGSSAILVDLVNGIEIDELVENNLTLNKLYERNTHWQEDLLEQLPEELRDNAHFHGFSQGDWVDPETVQWADGEGYVTTTVYNLEVENTHTYFVGKHGIWVHNCDGEVENNLTQATIESFLPIAEQYWITAGISEYEIQQKMSHYTIDIREINDSAAALINATEIVFSPNAAGMGWFIDSTPLDSSEFNMLSEDYGTTIDENLAGRVDLLTVLIHEIGHAMGLNHIDVDNDIMNAVLETGVRRLPTQKDVAQLLETQDISESHNFEGTHLLIKRNARSSTASAWHSSIEVSPQFSKLHNLNQMWQTQGDVRLGENLATLQEIGNTHTNLSQAFKIGAQDRLLTFTVKDAYLTDVNNGPDDAFEVALLDANTGEALFKVNDLSHSDALLNLQANGENYLAQGIKRIINDDGSQTLYINLDKALAGRDVLLSFDLLGFGAAESLVTLSNIGLVTEPLAMNDHYQFDEDHTNTGNVLDNDFLIGKSIENVVLETAPQHGELALLESGEFSYVPHANYFGQDQFSYYFVTVDGQQSKVATIQFDINPVNDAPIFSQQPSWEIIAGEPLVLDFNHYIEDVESNPITVQITQQPQSGSISYDAATGQFVYLVDKDFVGDDAFTVVLSDGTDSSQPYHFKIHVLPSNTAPELNAQEITTDEDQVIIFDPLASAYDADGDVLGTQITVQPQSGRLEQLADGGYQYVPNANYNGTDSFSYYVTDGELNSQVVVVSITVNAVNDAPTLAASTFITDEDTAVTMDLLATAHDIDGDALTTVIVNEPINGQLVALDNGQYQYVPNVNYNGADSFSYYVTDGELKSETKVVSITINAVNDAPTLAASAFITDEDTAVTMDLLATAHDIDSDALTTVIVAEPINGQLVALDNGQYQYVPNANYNGADSFSYYVTDGELNSETKVVSITVNAVNDAPTLAASTFITDEDTAVTMDLLATAHDIDGDALTTVIVNEPINGQLVALENGQYQYVPNANYNGADSFSYYVTDGELNSETKVVSITVNAVNDAPTASTQTILGLEDQILVLKWSDFAVHDVDGDNLSIEISILPQSGLLQQLINDRWELMSIGTRINQADIDAEHIRFVPNFNEASDGAIAGIGNQKTIYAQIGYKAFDGQLYSKMTWLNIEIEAVADQPILNIGLNNNREVLFQTSWETAKNLDQTSTLIEQNMFEGWTLLKGSDCNLFGKDGFEIWSNNDRMQNANGQFKTVQAKVNNGNNWLELNDAGLLQAQTLGIARNVQTELGRSYNLSFDYAGRLGFSECFTQIGIYIDGKRIATYTNTSPDAQLNWKNIQYSFVGTGKLQNIQIRTDAPVKHLNGRGAMIDNIVLSTNKPLNVSKEDFAMQLSSLSAQLQDNDGSEQLKLAIAGMPIGSALTDGSNQFVVTEQHTVADISTWNLSALQFTPPKDFSGELKLQVIASSIEKSNASVASAIHELSVVVEAVADLPSIETQQAQNALTSREIFNTQWQAVYNSSLNKKPSIAYGLSLDGWVSQKDQLFKLDAFEVWHSGDQVKNAANENISLQGTDSNAWIRLNDGMDKHYQQTAIERQLNTVNGTTYTLSFNMAGLLSQNVNMGRVGVYVDGQQIAIFDAESGQTTLNWQEYRVSFSGNGSTRSIRLQLEGNLKGRSAFIGHIHLVETFTSTANQVYAIAGQTAHLPVIAAQSNDVDGSEKIKLELTGFTKGSVVTDGINYITIDSTQQWIDISTWDWAQLRFASNRIQDMVIQIKATAIEQSNQHSVSSLKTIAVKMLNGQACTNPWQLANGFVSTWNNHVKSTPLAFKLQRACPIRSISAHLELSVLPKDEREDPIIMRHEHQSDAWLKSLERTAQQNWNHLL